MYRILIADDEGIMLESLKNIISSNYGNECEIHTAKTGRVVVEEAEKYPPDICFMSEYFGVDTVIHPCLLVRFCISAQDIFALRMYNVNGMLVLPPIID